MKERKLKIKLLKALRDGFLTYEELLEILKVKNDKKLQAFKDAANELYSQDLVLPVNFGDEKGLILLKK